LANLFHACLSYITAPLRDAGISGLPMASGDGQIRRCHAIVACYIGDYPEQYNSRRLRPFAVPKGSSLEAYEAARKAGAARAEDLGRQACCAGGAGAQSRGGRAGA
ncbi:hypothetical protein B0H10DRAFT_1831641, partial [Mycena sp. CBHHK59/15]